MTKINSQPKNEQTYRDFADLISKVSPKQAKVFKDYANCLNN